MEPMIVDAHVHLAGALANPWVDDDLNAFARARQRSGSALLRVNAPPLRIDRRSATLRVVRSIMLSLMNASALPQVQLS